MRRHLIVANQTLGGEHLLALVRDRMAAGACRFHVLVPATPSLGDLYRPLAYSAGIEGVWPLMAAGPDQDGEGQERAQAQLDLALRRLHALGADADGEVGDADPLVAIRQVLRRHAADEIIVSTLPVGLSRWLRMDLPSRVERTFDLPVTHVVAPADALR